jgi:hypothetical protein
MKTGGFSLATPSDIAAAQMDAKAAVSNAANNM